MLIDKPRCNFKNCRYCFDGNCISADKYENCQLTDLHCEIAKLTVDLDNAKSEWISVEERLPAENGRYLVCVNVSHLAFTSLTIIAVMEYGKNHGFYLYSEDEPVTHWMPLPEAPKKGGGEG